MKLMERVLGLEHPDTLNYASKFATALTHQNKTKEAKDFAKRLAERAHQQLGANNASAQQYAQLVRDIGVYPDE